MRSLHESNYYNKKLLHFTSLKHKVKIIVHNKLTSFNTINRDMDMSTWTLIKDKDQNFKKE